MTSEEIYIEVCKMYFRENFSKGEIAHILGVNLLDYIHETKQNKYKMTDKLQIVETIILNEIESHAQSKYY
jgi:hypothetical protein